MGQSNGADRCVAQVSILKTAVGPYSGRGSGLFEYSIPRLGKRIDVLALIGGVIFVIEFKVGEKIFSGRASIRSAITHRSEEL